MKAPGEHSVNTDSRCDVVHACLVHASYHSYAHDYGHSHACGGVNLAGILGEAGQIQKVCWGDGWDVGGVSSQLGEGSV